jgi:hypothetical protein
VRLLFAILGAVGLVIVVAGAINHAIAVRIDYVVGTSTPISLFWITVAAAVIIVAAGVLGVLVGQSAASGERRKLKAELEDTYRRLRAAQAEIPARMAPTSTTAVASSEVGMAEATPPEPQTIVAPAPPEPQTGVAPAPPEPQTVIEPSPAEAQTTVGPPPE